MLDVLNDYGKCGILKRTKEKQRMKSWMLKKEGCCVVFREELRQAVGNQEVPL